MESLVTYAFLGTFALLVGLDALRPAHRFPAVRWWRVSGLALTVVSLVASGLVPIVFDEWLAAHRLIDATSLGIAGGAVVGFVILELGQYAWHRAIHRVPWLWRMHQMHHSAERVDIYGALYFHPLDIAAFTLVSSILLVLVVGVHAEAAVLAVGIATLLATFQHANVRTPAWLGVIVQRPESHALHHQRGVHSYNYCDLPFIDRLFGTFRNPAQWEEQAGFYDGASRRIPEMLLGLDVTQPPSASVDADDERLAA